MPQEDGENRGSMSAGTPPTAGKPARRQPPPHKPRLTVVGTVHYQAPGSDPVSVPIATARFMDSDEQPFARTLKITAEQGWLPIDTGWLGSEDAGYLTIRNAGQKPVLVGVSDLSSVTPLFSLMFGECLPGTPVTLSRLRLHCPDGESKVSILVVPK